MANHATQQRMDEELKKFLKKLYPNKPMPRATRQLAEDLWDDLIFGRRIKTKYKERLRDNETGKNQRK